MPKTHNAPTTDTAEASSDMVALAHRSSPSHKSLKVLPLESIAIEKRARAYHEEQVEELKTNILTVGLISPISVRAAAEEETYILVAGRHRLEAFKQLLAEEHTEYATIPAFIVDSENAQDIEISENLYRNDLTVLEKAEHLRAYLKDKKEVTKIIESLASRAQQSRRNFFRYKIIGSGLQVANEVKVLGTDLVNSTSQLYFLAQLDKKEQEGVMKELKKNPELTVRQAHAIAQGKQQQEEFKNPPVSLAVPENFRSKMNSFAKQQNLKQGQFVERFLDAAIRAYESGNLQLEE